MDAKISPTQTLEVCLVEVTPLRRQAQTRSNNEELNSSKINNTQTKGIDMSIAHISTTAAVLVYTVPPTGTLLGMWLYKKFPKTGALLLRKKPICPYVYPGDSKAEKIRGIE